MPGVDQRQLDLFDRRRARQQIELWNTKPILRLRTAASWSSLSRADFLAVERVAAAGGQVQTAQDVHQRALARAARAHDRDQLAVVDLQADAAQRVHLDRAHAIGLDDV